MNRPISNVAATPQNGLKNPVQPPADSSRRVFTRTTQGAATDTPEVDGVKQKLNYMVSRNGRFVPENATPVVHAARIPARSQADSKELKMLRTNAQNLLEKMDRSAFVNSGRSVSFETHRGEKATVSQGSDGSVTISMNGREEITAFRDAHNKKDIHVLVKGPDGKMHAGRNLPSDYALQATKLVNSALYARLDRSPATPL